MILVLSVRLARRIYWYLSACAPSNALIRYLRAPAGRRWAFPISLAVAAGYLAVLVGLTAIIEAGGPGWLNLVAFICAWNAIKLGWWALFSIWSVFPRTSVGNEESSLASSTSGNSCEGPGN